MTETRRAVSTILAAFLILAPTSAIAQTPPPNKQAVEEASTRYRRGVQFVKEENYRGALTEFRRAYELTHDFHVLYNIAQMCNFLQDYVCAATTYESYLKEGSEKVEKDRRGEVESAIREMKGRIAHLTVTTNVPDVDISVDDQPRGKTPFAAPLPLSAGSHRLTAVKAGKIPVTRTFDVAGGDTPTIDIDLVDSQQQVVVRDQGPREEGSKMTTLSWIGVGAAGALAIGAGVTGALALTASNDLKTTPYPDASSQASKVKTLRLTSDILTGAAIVTLGTTIYFTLTRKPHVEPPPPAAGKLHLDVALGPTSASVFGTF